MFKILNLKKAKTYTLAVALSLPLFAFSQTKSNPSSSDQSVKTVTDDKVKIDVDFKQRHSKNNQQDLYADGIKIKRDISLIEKVQEERMLDMDEIPADDVYGGVWGNSRVNMYSAVEAKADTFTVDLRNFTMPTMGYMTSNFGKRRRRMHYGVDLKVQTGDTIYAAFDGKVRLCQYERRGYGYYVVVRHPNGLETVYGHLSAFLVKENEVVKSGQPIALGGNTGRSTGSHLHLEFRYLGQPIDPNKIVDFDNKVCHRDTYLITPKTFNLAGVRNSSLARKTTARNTRTANKSKTNKYVSGKVNYYRVKKGDTLGKIAQRHRTSVKKLCRLNNLTTRTILRLGQSIRVS